MDKKDALIEYDLLKGNINRMFFTDSIDEVEQMAIWANRRLEEIRQFNINRLR